ncbi:MAG: type VI secretion system baseplate subunit TssG [Bryobacterales bacterium]|nr:type VI secretion system baseplate subunit TssG [Bryobacteraceae bacterium]MDW8129667.1 type VI secretion system baseplate subunit TssG [Bryobacterales bacterium]
MSGEAPTLPSRGQAELERALEREPWRFDFFQAVRLLERLDPERKPVGRFVRPRQEVVRFAANPSVVFPASQIQSLELRPDGPARMTVNFMGLFGPMGVLPQAYTELIISRIRERDYALRDFLDLFNHRMISLFYRAWERYRFGISYERGEKDRLSGVLLDLIGLGTPGLQGRQAVEDQALLYYAGLLAQFPRSASALEQILGDYFDVPVEVVQFAGGWYRLDPQIQGRLDETNEEYEQLAVGAVIGDEVWESQARVRVRLGPLTLEQYLEFLPTGSAFEPLRALIRFFAGDQLDFEVQLVLRRDEVPCCELGAETGAAPRLGWVSWIRWSAMTRDPEETVLRLQTWAVNRREAPCPST